jgi:hypothetical protein
MKKVVRLTETDLARLVKRVIEEQKYGSFGNFKRKDKEGDDWVDDNDRYVRKSEELYGLGDPEEFDTEEFDDYDSYREKYSDEDENTPRWFGKGETGRKIFDTYREKSGRPFKVKTKRQRD